MVDAKTGPWARIRKALREIVDEDLSNSLGEYGADTKRAGNKTVRQVLTSIDKLKTDAVLMVDDELKRRGG